MATYSTAGVFAALDRNHDGFITKTEFFSIVGSSPAAMAAFDSLDRNRDGVISVREFKERYPNGIPTPTVSTMSMFAALDRNGDGFVTKTEFLNVVGSSVAAIAAFEALDRNRDGAISVREFKERYPNGIPAVSAPLSPVYSTMGVFGALDRNGDGFVTKTEFFAAVGNSAAAVAAFESLDRNHDGAISVREFKERYPSGILGSPAPVVSMPLVPATLAAKIAEEERFAMEWRAKKGIIVEKISASSMFGALDRNGDGFVTKTEFFSVIGNSPAAAGAFASLDRNGDGCISVREFKERFPNGVEVATTKPNHLAAMIAEEERIFAELFAGKTRKY